MALLPRFLLRAGRQSRLLYDTFTGSGALTAHTPEVGGPWAVLNGAFSNLSGGVLPYNTGNYGCAMAPLAADVEIESYMNIIGVSNYQMGLVGRSLADATNRIALVINGSSGAKALYAFTALNTPGTPTTVTVPTGSGWTLPSAGWHTVKWGMYRNEHRMWLDDSIAGVAQLATYATNTYGGVGCFAIPTGGSWSSIAVSAASSWLTLSAIGDSITAGAVGTYNWFGQVSYGHNSGRYYTINHAVGGAKVVNDGAAGYMAQQVTAAATDSADTILILIGTNDSAVELPTFQATYLANLQALQASNPAATIYALGVLERTPDLYVATKNGYIAAACASAGVEFWDTTGWIVPATDTSDGLHLNASGNLKVATQVMARL